MPWVSRKLNASWSDSKNNFARTSWNLGIKTGLNLLHCISMNNEKDSYKNGIRLVQSYHRLAISTLIMAFRVVNSSSWLSPVEATWKIKLSSDSLTFLHSSSLSVNICQVQSFHFLHVHMYVCLFIGICAKQFTYKPQSTIQPVQWEHFERQLNQHRSQTALLEPEILPGNNCLFKLFIRLKDNFI